MKYKFSHDSLPRLSHYALTKKRPETESMRFDQVITVELSKVMFGDNDPRVDTLDPKHTSDIQINFDKAGCDENGEIPSIMPSDKYDGMYEVVDNHHVITALKNRKQIEYRVNLYHYVANKGDAHKWAAATELGFIINNEHNPVKRTSMASVVGVGKKKLRELGYIYELGEDPSQAKENCFKWFKACGHDLVFANTTLGIIASQILDEQCMTGTKIRPLTDSLIEKAFASSHGRYGTAELPDNRYGYLVKTDNYGADAPKGYNQVITSLAKDNPRKPVFMTYSGKDDAELIKKNHYNYIERMYQTHLKHLKTIPAFYPISITPLTKREFLDKIEVVAIGQIEGEYDECDFVNRSVL
tara:strand:- start:143 stop:1210 length:1068 start_codon:yes stop_codon:yes gene_type:complete